jgi:hypothetical protein
LSPEQAVGGAITPASDIYSTSVVLYEMLVGRVPFVEDDPLAMLTAHVGREPPFFAELAPDAEVPPGLEDIVRHGMGKVAAERIGSAQQYLQLLEPFGVGALSGARASQSLAIPAGPHSQPLAAATPMPFTYATPVPGAPVTYPTPVPTPIPTDYRDFRSAPTAIMATDRSRPSAMSVAEHGAPIPRRWIAIGGVCLVIAIALAIVLVVTRHDDDRHAPAGPPPAVLAPPPPSSLDREIQLKAALHDLEDGKTCADRRAAIETIVGLHDPRAIPDLKRARYRGAGGVLGVGESNANGCLTKDADAAIRELGGK